MSTAANSIIEINLLPCNLRKIFLRDKPCQKSISRYKIRAEVFFN